MVVRVRGEASRSLNGEMYRCNWIPAEEEGGHDILHQAACMAPLREGNMVDQDKGLLGVDGWLDEDRAYEACGLACLLPWDCP